MSKITCNHLGCTNVISTSLLFACGDNQEETEYSCGKYFCSDHRKVTVELEDGTLIKVYEKCEDYLIDSGEWYENPVDKILIKLNT